MTYGAQIMNETLSDIFKDTRCFILDMDGTIYLSNRLFDFTTAFLDGLDRRGRDYYFFTNNSSKNSGFYINKLKALGIAVDRRRLMTANDVIISHLRRHYAGLRIYVAGTELLKAEFAEAGLQLADDDGADLAVLGFDTELVYEKLRICCDMARAGKPVLGVNPDFNCPVENGYIPDCGSIARLIEASTGVLPKFFGKPSREALDYVIEKTGYPEEALCFVGDRLYTDIAIAHERKCKSVLVLTGETKRDDLLSSAFKPSLVVESASDIIPLI